MFGRPISFDPDILFNEEKLKNTLELILKYKCYFKPEYYRIDVDNRRMMSVDGRIRIQLNFQFLSIDEKYLYFLMSILQLDLIGVLQDTETEEYLTIISKLLSLNCELKHRRKVAWLRILRRGFLIEERFLTLTDTEFEFNVSNNLQAFQYKRRGYGRFGGNDSS